MTMMWGCKSCGCIEHWGLRLRKKISNKNRNFLSFTMQKSVQSSNAILHIVCCDDLLQSQNEWKTNWKWISAVKISEKKKILLIHLTVELSAVQFLFNFSCSFAHIFFSSIRTRAIQIYTIRNHHRQVNSLAHWRIVVQKVSTIVNFTQLDVFVECLHKENFCVDFLFTSQIVREWN